MLTVDVLQRFPEAREKWAKSFRYILVDEYQDTNHAQYVLLQLLAGEHQNLMAVGRPGPVDLRVPRRRHPQHPASSSATSPNTQVIPLEQNYRSTNTILQAANDGDREQPRAQGEAPLVGPRRRRAGARRRDRGRARRGAVRRGRDRRADRGGYSAAEIAVVYRTNAQSRVLEDVLVRQGDRLPGDRRPALLRARRDQGR